MSNQYHSQGILPSFRELTSGLQHQESAPQNNYQAQAFAPQRNQQLPQPFGPPVLQPLSTNFRYTTEVHSSAEEASSNDDEMSSTPGASRESSLNRTVVPERRGSRLSISHRAPKRANRRSSPPATAGTKVKKTLKEKQSRLNQGQVTYHAEDFMESYVGWSRFEQSGGNGTAAGLQSNKIHVQRAEFAMFRVLMHDAYLENARRGTLDEWKARMRQAADEAVDGDESLLITTFLESIEEPCGHADTKSKPCVTHGTPNWIPCRKEHNAITFRRNEAEWYRQENIPHPEAYRGLERQMPIHSFNTRAATGQRAYSRHA